jgi:hypothetical protein
MERSNLLPKTRKHKENIYVTLQFCVTREKESLFYRQNSREDAFASIARLSVLQKYILWSNWRLPRGEPPSKTAGWGRESVLRMRKRPTLNFCRQAEDAKASYSKLEKRPKSVLKAWWKLLTALWMRKRPEDAKASFTLFKSFFLCPCLSFSA